MVEAERTKRKDNQWLGFEQPYNFKPLLKATAIISSRDTSYVPSWNGLMSAGINSAARREASYDCSLTALARGEAERFACAARLPLAPLTLLGEGIELQALCCYPLSGQP